ncbi:GAF domain-containing protein, partial [Streptomyces sp. 8N616]|uniref:GAF domain-containing protein n=1 Tax=Streptomyces sp. 8N616 TaxID=3457414 RepID=UPI003FD17D1B
MDTARELAALHDLESTLKIITRRARLLLGVDMSYIGLPDDEGAFCVCASDGHTAGLNVGLRLPASTEIGSVVTTGPSPFCTPDYLDDQRFEHSESIDEAVGAEGLHAVMAVPLSDCTQSLGALYVADRRVRHFTADEIALLSFLGDIAGVAIERARQWDRMIAQVRGLRQGVSRCEADLRSTEELSAIHDQLIELVLRGGDLRALAEEVSQRLNSGLLIFAANGTVLATAGNLPEKEEGALLVAAVDAHTIGEPAPVQLDDGMWTMPVATGNEYLGTLFLDPGRPLTDRDQQLLRRAAQTAAVMLLLQNSRTATADGHVRDELLDDLLVSPQRPRPQLERRARRFGIDLKEPHVVVVARPEGGAQAKTCTWASSYAHRMNGLKSMQGDSAVLLLPAKDAGEAARMVCDELSPLLGHPVTVAAAGPVSDPGAVFQGYQEAARCLDAMTVLGAVGSAASARELGFLGVLLSDSLDAEGFIDSVIGPVFDYDRQRFTELTRTMDAYFDTGGSPRYAAEKLHVHPNTVVRRLERI